jgi:hypothetical protein
MTLFDRFLDRLGYGMQRTFYALPPIAVPSDYLKELGRIDRVRVTECGCGLYTCSTCLKPITGRVLVEITDNGGRRYHHEHNCAVFEGRTEHAPFPFKWLDVGS